MREAIRAHRDAKGDDRCWLDDYLVWEKLADTTPEPFSPPPYEEALEKCRDYFSHRRNDKVPVNISASQSPDRDLESMNPEHLASEAEKLHMAIRRHRDIANRSRTIEDDCALYAALPEKIEADFRLPSEAAFLGEAKAPHAGCPSFWRSHAGCKTARHNLHRWGPCKVMGEKPIETNWIVITGAPSSGKTSVIEFLENLGYRYMPETARAYLERELAKGRSLSDIKSSQKEFQQDLLREKIEMESRLPPDEMVFLDRAIPDSISYYRANGLDPREAMEASKKFRYRKVFIFDRLPFKYDGVRVDNEEIAEKLDHLLEADYRLMGYEPVRVPVMSIEARVDFILRKLELSGKVIDGNRHKICE